MTGFKSASAFAALAVAGIAVTLSAPAAWAEPQTVVGAPLPERTHSVSYADLNLATTAGEKTLKMRVHKAVRTLCRNGVQSSAETRASRTCSDFAWRGATPQMAAAVKRAREIAQTGRSSIRVSAIRIRTPL